MNQNQTESKPEDAEQPSGKGLSSSALLADLESWMAHAEKRYNEEQQDGDAISIASTRGTFLAIRDARALVRKHLPANDKPSGPAGRDNQ